MIIYSIANGSAYVSLAKINGTTYYLSGKTRLEVISKALSKIK